MSRPWIVGWYFALGWWFVQFKHSGFKHGWRRRKILAQMVRKRYFWMTPAERAKNMGESLEALRKLGNEIRNARPTTEGYGYVFGLETDPPRE